MLLPVCLIVAVLSASTGIRLASAASDYDSATSAYNGCIYWISAQYDTAVPFGKVEGDDVSDCADLFFQRAYFWDDDINDFRDYEYGWASGMGAKWVAFFYTTNVYGYMQIQEPTGFYSSTIEAHAN